MHGGTIEARSDGLGQGATFTVRVPLAAMRRSPVPAAPVRPMTAAPGLEQPDELQGLRVLIVDDEPDARELVAEVLSACGATVVAAASVLAAKTAIEAGVPDVLISDIGMPDEDGYSLIAHIPRAPARARRLDARCLSHRLHDRR